MAVVAGVIFFIVRAFFALIPGLADRAPIKKWAALAALLVTGFYLILSGNQVATQRSFIMIGVRPTGRAVRPSSANHAHPDHRRAGGTRVRAGIDRASEFPDVVCRDTGADRRL
jgi:hypothetical protein